ncbi:hypothetical protein [Undibacterium sp.]|uniref:hypothetical protein n=1 Tax=Undibacterium sp. TaxID=1914977 RepID=UPI0025F17C4B|nr:hypothetical protein [Undibacterium sp.]
MSPTAKFNALLASVTVMLMFFVVAYLAPIMRTAGVDYPALLSIAALVTSAGVYRLLTLGLRWLMERIELLRGLVLGPYYMHGTWVGWFRGHSGELRYMVEHFAQDLDSLVITGRSYTAAMKEHGYWVSESVTVDAKRGQLIFTYSFDVLTQSSSLAGIHTSIFERKSAHDAPTGISGFAHDLNDKTRIAVHSKKVSSRLLSWEESLSQAASLFKNV